MLLCEDARSKHAHERLGILVFRGPACRETHNRVMLVWLLPEACKRHFAETLCLGVGEDGEDLVRLGRMGKRDAGIFEGMRDLVRVAMAGLPMRS